MSPEPLVERVPYSKVNPAPRGFFASASVSLPIGATPAAVRDGFLAGGSSQPQRTKSPLFPPDFSISRTPLMVMPRSTALHMS
jgi:hypothetical protein